MPHSVELLQTQYILNTIKNGCIQHSIVIPMEDPILHNEGRPFCADRTCPCREDVDNINLLEDLIKQGLLTAFEAEMVMRGATI